MRIDLEVEGIERARAIFQEIDSNWQREVESDLDEAGKPLQYALQEYPPPIPTSDYVRTYTYRELVDVHTQIMGSEVELVAEQLADYSIYLRGDGASYAGAWMHRGRWRTLLNIIETYVPVTLSLLERRLESWLRLITGD